MGLDLTDTLHFGKYNGKTVRDVAVNKPDYIQWLIREKNSSMFSPDVVAVVRVPNINERVKLAAELISAQKTAADDDDFPFEIRDDEPF